MKDVANTPPKTSRKFGTVWGELEYVCRKIHYWLYERNDRTSARRYLGRLQRIVGDLPDSDLAILRAEGLALLHELRGELSDAVAQRRREIHLMERLQRSVDRSVREARYDERMAAAILAGRDSAALEERRNVLQALAEELRCKHEPGTSSTKSIRGPLDSGSALRRASMRAQRRQGKR